MHPVMLLAPLGIVYTIAVGYTRAPLMYALVGAAALCLFGIGRAVIAQVGPIGLQAMSAGAALSRGFDNLRERIGTRGISMLVIGQTAEG